jgi:leucyl-tRNA synthetase
MHFNTAIAAIMEHLNKIYAIKEPEKMNNVEKAIFAKACAVIPRLLYFFAPHISEELWQLMGNENLVHEAGIPEFEPKFLVKDEVTYVVQVMGKLRGKIDVPLDMPQEEIKKLALELENVQKHIAGKTVLKVIVVPKKLISIVVK